MELISRKESPSPSRQSQLKLIEEKPPICFVRAPSSSLICPIHKGLLNKPVIAPCGHSFCQKCLERYLDDLGKSRIPECPIDNFQFKTLDFIPNLAVSGQVNDLLVYCKYRLKFNSEEEKWGEDPEGCKEEIKYAEYAKHEEICQFAPIVCPNCNDGKQIKRKDFEQHRKLCKNCPCPHSPYGCKFSGSGSGMEDHLKECEFEKIKGFLKYNQIQMNEIKTFLLQKEDENRRLKESLVDLHRKFDQVLNIVEITNGRVENAVHFMTTSFEDIKRELTAKPATPSPTPLPIGVKPQGKPTAGVGGGGLLGIGPSAKPNVGGGHVIVPGGLNITCVNNFTGHTGPVWALSAGEGMLISGSSDSTVKVWELATSECKQTLRGHEGIVHAVAINNRHVISGSSDKLIKVWDLETGKCIRTLTEHENTVCSLVVAGGYIFSGSYTEIKVWNPHTYKEEETLRGHNHWVRAIAIQDRLLYSGSHNIIKVWNLDTFQCTGTITAQCGSIYSLAVAGNRLLAGTFENLIYVWDLDTNRCIATLHGHYGAVYNLCVSGDHLFSASYDTTIRVWSLENLRCIQTIGHHNSSVEALVLWGGFLFSGSADTTIKVWR